MKFIFVLLLLSPLPSMACMNQLPLSEVQKALALEAGAGAVRCEDKKDEPCICFDGIDFQTAKLSQVKDESDSVVGYKLEEDAEKKAAKEVKVAADKAAAEAVETQEKQRLQKIKQLAKKSQDLSPEEMQELIKALASQLSK